MSLPAFTVFLDRINLLSYNRTTLLLCNRFRHQMQNPQIMLCGTQSRGESLKHYIVKHISTYLSSIGLWIFGLFSSRFSVVSFLSLTTVLSILALCVCILFTRYGVKSYALFRKNANIRLPKPYLEAKLKRPIWILRF